MKEKLKTCLENDDFEGIRLLAMQRKVVLSKLLSITFSPDHDTRWKAVKALGIAASIWIGLDEEYVRDFCRRLMWMLNDESGNMGWFAPQALGEILSRNHQTLDEFLPMLLAVLDGDERPEIISGTLWAIGRIGPINQEFTEEATKQISKYLDDPNPDICIEASKALQIFQTP